MVRTIPVVINADDFGYSEAVNVAIAEALRLRRISSASTMANAPAVAEALAIAASHPEASFGIHLNLTEFAPLTAPESWSRLGLLDASGRFNGEIRRRRPSLRLLRAVAREWEAQIQHLRALGLTPSHLDSHHHVHTIPWLLPVLAWLQRRHRLPLLRNTLSVYPPNHRPAWTIRLAKGLWSATCRHLLGSRMPDVFADLDQFLLNAGRRAFLNAASIELMCHPGQVGFEAQTGQLLASDRPGLPAPFVLVPFAQACGGSPSTPIPSGAAVTTL